MKTVIKRIINGPWFENCYVVSNNQSSVIIDPGGNVNEIIQYIKDCQYKVMAILNTHAHFDHIGGVADLIDEYRCSFYLHSKDSKLLRSANLYQKIFGAEQAIRIPEVNIFLDKIPQVIELGDLSVEVLHTPGHTEGSVCFCIEDNLFTGDTLLKGTIGRTDLPGGSKPKIKESLRVISKLPDEKIIFPGHGEASTIADELKFNDLLINVVNEC